MKLKQGQISILYLLGIGLTLSTALAGVFWTKMIANDVEVGKINQQQSQTNERVASVEEAVKTIKDDNRIIKEDIKELLRRVK